MSRKYLIVSVVVMMVVIIFLIQDNSNSSKKYKDKKLAIRDCIKDEKCTGTATYKTKTRNGSSVYHLNLLNSNNLFADNIFSTTDKLISVIPKPGIHINLNEALEEVWNDPNTTVLHKHGNNYLVENDSNSKYLEVYLKDKTIPNKTIPFEESIDIFHNQVDAINSCKTKECTQIFKYIHPNLSTVFFTTKIIDGSKNWDTIPMNNTN